MREIKFTETAYLRQLAILFLSAPTDSEDERLLCEALEGACERAGLRSDEFVEAVRRTVAVHEVELGPAANAVGGVA